MAEDLREELEKNHQDAFVWAMRCSGQNADLAKEAIQMVYLKILEGKARFKGYSKFNTWLFTIIRNTINDLHRTQKLRSKKQQRFLVDFDEQVEDYNEEDGRTAELKKRIKELPLRQQQVLELKCYHDLTLEEIAEIMDITIGSVRQHYDRAKKKIKEILTSVHEKNERRR